MIFLCQCFLLIIGIILVAGFVNPWVFIPTLPLVILFMWIRRYYLYTSRSIKRLEGICKKIFSLKFALSTILLSPSKQQVESPLHVANYDVLLLKRVTGTTVICEGTLWEKLKDLQEREGIERVSCTVFVSPFTTNGQQCLSPPHFLWYAVCTDSTETELLDFKDMLVAIILKKVSMK